MIYIKSLTNLIEKLAKSKIAKKIVHYYFVRHWENIAAKYKLAKDINKKPRLLWGTVPILNYKYWSNSMRDLGFESNTLMQSYYSSINEKEDYDLYFEDIVRNNYLKIPIYLRLYHKNYFVFDYILKNCDIIHTCCDALTDSFTKESEMSWLNKFGIRSIVIPYGGDMFSYSKMLNISRRHSAQVNYPLAAKNEEQIEKNVNACVKYCDIFLPAFQIDGIGRWDLLPCNAVTINTEEHKSKTEYNRNDGKNGVVTILHAPNHRGPKGTDYIIQAIEELKSEGINVKFILLEKTQNSEVLRMMREEADIAIDEIVGTFYALFSIEAMASGIPVINNLESEDYTRVFRRFSYLNEAPLVSGSIENIKQILRILIANPKLREELGIAGRKFVEKYHSDKASQYMFESIYEKIWFKRKGVDLMNLYNPMKKESYNNQSPKIEHPLFENKIPEALLNTLNKKRETHLNNW